jgi:hypothetical protein
MIPLSNASNASNATAKNGGGPAKNIAGFSLKLYSLESFLSSGQTFANACMRRENLRGQPRKASNILSHMQSVLSLLHIRPIKYNGSANGSSAGVAAKRMIIPVFPFRLRKSYPGGGV